VDLDNQYYTGRPEKNHLIYKEG